jgi:hypothetical protein
MIVKHAKQNYTHFSSIFTIEIRLKKHMSSASDLDKEMCHGCHFFAHFKFLFVIDVIRNYPCFHRRVFYVCNNISYNVYSQQSKKEKPQLL